MPSSAAQRTTSETQPPTPGGPGSGDKSSSPAAWAKSSVERLAAYTLGAQVGGGSLAAVFHATHAATGTPHAIKLLRPQWKGHPAARTLLAREAQVGSAVRDPRVVAVREAHLDADPPYLVMDWVAGKSAADLLRAPRKVVSRKAHDADAPPRRGMLVPEALWIVRQAAEGLLALERGGFVHGDVKPANILVDTGGNATLIDLGFARRRDEPCVGRLAVLAGTAPYMAPELIASTEPTDLRADFYSLGASLYELLTGRLPFPEGPVTEVLQHHRHSMPPDPRRFAPQVPKSICNLLAELLAKHPLRRPQTAAELLERLVALEIENFAYRYVA